MDAAKSAADGQDFLLVSAKEQTRGKGTRGRPWTSVPGNIYMTVGIHRRRLPSSRLALLPLEAGLHLWECVAAALPRSAPAGLTLKWPNDLLLSGRKAAGILMESHGEFLMIGIGINVAGAPTVDDGGTPAACLAQAGMEPAARRPLIEDLYRRFREAPWQDREQDPEGILLRWQGKVDWNRTHRLRDRPGTPEVVPMSVNRLGHLQVRHADGSREWLVSDYLA